MTTRVNARLSEEVAKKLNVLKLRTGRSTTEIVRESIESYYAVMTSRASSAQLLADFVGSGDASPRLSEDYKRELLESLAGKA